MATLMLFVSLSGFSIPVPSEVNLLKEIQGKWTIDLDASQKLPAIKELIKNNPQLMEELAGLSYEFNKDKL